MSEYIKRKAVINKVNEIPAHFNSGDIRYGIEIAIQAIKDTPTADVAEVVRCKDCKYYQDNNNGYPHNECKWCKDETPDAYDFCSYGERKDEE